MSPHLSLSTVSSLFSAVVLAWLLARPTPHPPPLHCLLFAAALALFSLRSGSYSVPRGHLLIGGDFDLPQCGPRRTVLVDASFGKDEPQ